MTLVYACVAPHGGEVIPELAPKRARAKFRDTTDGMRRIARDVAIVRPHTIIIASPHNLRLSGKIGIITAENSTGRLQGSGKRFVVLKAKCDVKFARELIVEAAARGLPVVGANYGTSEGVTSDMPMDWGTLVPLWFILSWNRIRARIVVVTPSREIPLRQNVEFGKVIARLSEEDGKRFVFIASADQAHAHSKSGPYGFSPDARRYDDLVLDAIRTNRLGLIRGPAAGFAERAKPDSLWQMAMLLGVTEVVRMRAGLVSYQVPTYYGMMCARFERVRNMDGTARFRSRL